MPRASVAIAAVVVIGSFAAAAPAQFNPPPPQGGFDTGRCHGAAAHKPHNGVLVGKVRNRDGLYTVRPDGSRRKRLTSPKKYYGDFYPAPSPDGRNVAFLRMWVPNIDSKPIRLLTVNVRTHKTRMLRTDLFEAYTPAWSPDGQWITAGVDVHVDPNSHNQTRSTMLIHPDGTGLRALAAGGYLLLNGSWSPNGRCFAALATFQDRGPAAAYTGVAGLAVLSADGGRPNTFHPGVPCPVPGWPGCAANLPSFGANAPNYVTWTANGRGLLLLRGLFRKPTPQPQRIDVAESGLSDGAHGRVLVTKASVPHLSPDNRFVVAYQPRPKAFAVFRANGGLVNRLDKHFFPAAWAPARR
jgi:hypothetical protein